MFPTAHPDIMGQLANERAAGLRLSAATGPAAPSWPSGARPASSSRPQRILSRVRTGPHRGPARGLLHLHLQGRPGRLSGPAPAPPPARLAALPLPLYLSEAVLRRLAWAGGTGGVAP